MTAYLFGRNEWFPLQLDDAPTLATTVFYQMWKVRAHPYNRFEETDVVYVGRQDSRRIVWEVRPATIVKRHYESTRHALAMLRSVYGMYAGDLNGYHRRRSGTGWLLAWAPRVMRRVHVPLPAEVHFGQNGYRELAAGELASLGLPVPKRGRPLASPPSWYDADAAASGVIRHIPRYIPLRVRREVVERDHGACVGCGTTVNLHFDHIKPWSHGGESSAENLRLLCARSNLARGAGQVDDMPLCASGRHGSSEPRLMSP